jgi:hypothetical protein
VQTNKRHASRANTFFFGSAQAPRNNPLSHQSPGSHQAIGIAVSELDSYSAPEQPANLSLHKSNKCANCSDKLMKSDTGLFGFWDIFAVKNPGSGEEANSRAPQSVAFGYLRHWSA